LSYRRNCAIADRADGSSRIPQHGWDSSVLHLGQSNRILRLGGNSGRDYRTKGLRGLPRGPFLLAGAGVGRRPRAVRIADSQHEHQPALQAERAGRAAPVGVRIVTRRAETRRDSRLTAGCKQGADGGSRLVVTGCCL